ncbi:probable leucine-rich repeat receptor-like protein kinase At5g63930 [Papaver somniferum]|nr:probable leucine-rich repeat receptor-like protein kinase At5g63930 [Papaver somniferum]
MNLQELYLAGAGLVKLPEWLSSTSLFTLDVSSNRLVGKLPVWMAKMRNLHTLNVSNNGFHSDIPIEFENLARGLGVLDLHRNNFTGGLSTIFAVSGRFRYTFIDLSYNMFVGRIDNNIGNLESMAVLQTLVLSNNRLGGAMPKSLGKLSFLETLKLDNNEFTGTIPAELSSITFITSIVLSHNKLTGSIPSRVMNLLDIVEFDVSYNKLTGKIPPHKKPFPASSFVGNSGLCDSPLAPCKTA